MGRLNLRKVLARTANRFCYQFTWLSIVNHRRFFAWKIILSSLLLKLEIRMFEIAAIFSACLIFSLLITFFYTVLRSWQLRLLLLLHHADCLVIEWASDACWHLKVFITLQKLVELQKILPHILHTQSSVSVEIKAHVVVLHVDMHVGVCLLDVCYKFGLSIAENIDQHADEICRVIIEKYHFL